MTLRAVLYFRAKVTPLQKCRCAILTPTAEETNFPSKSPAEEINVPSIFPAEEINFPFYSPAQETNFPSNFLAEEINLASYSPGRCQNSTMTLLHGCQFSTDGHFST